MKHCAKCKNGSWGMLKLGDRIKLDDSIFDSKELCGKCWYILLKSIQELVRDIINDPSTLSDDIVVVEKKKERSEFETRCDNVQKKWPIDVYIEQECDDELDILPLSTGTNTHMECPGCNKRYSIRVGKDKKMFFCFNCKKGGDVIAFVCLQKKCSLLEAVEYLEKLNQ